MNLANEFLNLIIPLSRFQLNGGSLLLGTGDNINSTATSLKVGTSGSLFFALHPIATCATEPYSTFTRRTVSDQNGIGSSPGSSVATENS